MTQVDVDQLHELAKAVLARVRHNEVQVRLARIECDSSSPENLAMVVDAQVSITVSPAVHDNAVGCVVNYTLRAVTAPRADQDGEGTVQAADQVPEAASSAEPGSEGSEGGEGGEGLAAPETMWEATVAMQGQWSLNPGEALTDDHNRAFGILVGMMTLHPYARARIQDVTVATGWPPYTMDVIGSPADIFCDEHGKIELSSIGLLEAP